MEERPKATLIIPEDLEAYASFLDRQDMYLEQIELLLYRMERLAVMAALEIEDRKRQMLQSELEFIKVEIDMVSKHLQPYESIGTS